MIVRLVEACVTYKLRNIKKHSFRNFATIFTICQHLSLNETGFYPLSFVGTCCSWVFGDNVVACPGGWRNYDDGGKLLPAATVDENALETPESQGVLWQQYFIYYFIYLDLQQFLLSRVFITKNDAEAGTLCFHLHSCSCGCLSVAGSFATLCSTCV